MHPRRTRPDPTAAARRLALIAAASPPSSALAEEEAEDAWWADHTRIAAPVPAADPAPPTLPVPGRHAARRRLLPPVARLRPLLPALAPAHVAVVALVVALGLAVTAWWVVRADPGPSVVPVAGEAVSPPVGGATPAALTSAPVSAPAPLATGASSGASVTVDVAGKVRRPGIVVLAPGTRVADALRAAGGAKRGVDTTPLNLARVLVDGEQILVGGPAPPRTVAGPAGSAAPGTAGPLVNLNQAAQAELETLPEVGPVTAQAIIAWREQQGGFTSVDELLEVDGIGEKTLARLTPYVTV
ncbi:helix-hairpin-helix domain-containing protein [Nocardioides sp. LML1-1-1.1]|uniref:helix-hairpin-helix domain-containing protein n=1 Tax=Nocardioides sp. LML1-1-1.1 TaxID=3135248 RepID=UPI00341A542E